MAATVSVRVNGQADQVPDGTTVDEVIDRLGCGRSGVAVAVNEEVVPRSQWAATDVRSGDRIEVLSAAQGG
jgi:sulfur carrier protein